MMPTDGFSGFDKHFTKQRKRFSFIKWAAVFLFGIAVVGYSIIGGNFIAKNGSVVMIQYFDNQNERFAMASKILKQDKNCVTFINQFNMEETVCAQNISITKIK